MLFYWALISINTLAFIFYGLECLLSKKMADKFKRFGLTDFHRIQTGILELLGAVGSIVGLLLPSVGMVSTAGLGTLMLLAFMQRVKNKESLGASSPSLLFFLLYTFLFFYFYSNIR